MFFLVRLFVQSNGIDYLSIKHSKKNPLLKNVDHVHILLHIFSSLHTCQHSHRSLSLFRFSVRIKSVSLLMDESRLFFVRPHNVHHARLSNVEMKMHSPLTHRRTDTKCAHSPTCSLWHSNEQPVQKFKSIDCSVWISEVLMNSVLFPMAIRVCVYKSWIFCVVFFYFFSSFFSAFILTLDTRFYRSCGCDCCCFRHRRHHQPHSQYSHTRI